MCFNKLFFYLICLSILSIRMVLAVNISSDTISNTDSAEIHIREESLFSDSFEIVND